MATVPEAIEEYRRGKFVIITDDEDRENEGDLVMAAQFVTPDAINFMAKYGRGLICIPLTEERVAELQPADDVGTTNSSALRHAVHGLGRSPHRRHDRHQRRRPRPNGPGAHRPDVGCRTTSPGPGHMFPLRARDGGVLVRAGQTEASIDLCKMAGLYPGGVLCEIMKADGEMARMPDLKRFARRHGLKIVTVNEMIKYRLRNEQLVQRVAETKLPTPNGDMTIVAYQRRRLSR